MNDVEEAPSQPAPQAGSSYSQYPPPQAVVTPTDPRRKSPALACILSVMPGLGQVYVGYYQRGFIHAIVVATLIALAASNTLADQFIPMMSIFMAFFWLYNIIDAGRRATLYNEVLAGGTSIELPEDFKAPSIGGSIFGGLSLLVVGFILLLNTRFGVSLEWLEEWWPAAVMIFGAYLLGKALKERAAEQQTISGEEAEPF